MSQAVHQQVVCQVSCDSDKISIILPDVDCPKDDALYYCESYLNADKVNQGPWFQGMNQSLSAYCLTSWCNSLSQDTPYTTTETAPVYPPKYQPPGTTTTTLPVSTTFTITGYTSLPSFVSPCCGECPITVVSGAQVLYWPTPAPQPPVESVVDANGFTLYVLLSWFVERYS